MAARLDQAARDLATVLQDVDDGADALGEARFEPGLGKDEAQRRGQAAVDGLEIPFEGNVVGEIELADPRGVAGAAKILEQQRVIEILEYVIGQFQRLADAGADKGAADAMALGLTLGHVERITERAQEIGELEGQRAGGFGEGQIEA